MRMMGRKRPMLKPYCCPIHPTASVRRHVIVVTGRQTTYAVACDICGKILKPQIDVEN